MSKDMSELFKARSEKQLEELLAIYQEKCLEVQREAREKPYFDFILIAHRKNADANFCVYGDADEFAEDMFAFLEDDNFFVHDILHSRRDFIIIFAEASKR